MEVTEETNKRLTQSDFWQAANKFKERIDAIKEENPQGRLSEELIEELEKGNDDLQDLSNKCYLTVELSEKLVEFLKNMLENYTWEGAESFGVVDAYHAVCEAQQEVGKDANQDQMEYAIPSQSIQAIMGVLKGCKMSGINNAQMHRDLCWKFYQNSNTIREMNEEIQKISQMMIESKQGVSSEGSGEPSDEPSDEKGTDKESTDQNK